MLRLRDAALGDIKLDATGLASIRAFLDYYWKSGVEEVVAPKQAATEDDVRRLTAELAKRYGMHFVDRPEMGTMDAEKATNRPTK